MTERANVTYPQVLHVRILKTFPGGNLGPTMLGDSGEHGLVVVKRFCDEDEELAEKEAEMLEIARNSCGDIAPELLGVFKRPGGEMFLALRYCGEQPSSFADLELRDR